MPGVHRGKRLRKVTTSSISKVTGLTKSNRATVDSHVFPVTFCHAEYQPRALDPCSRAIDTTQHPP